MFELLVPPVPAQLQGLGNDKKAYDLQLRPALMVRAIHELQDAGVEADVWKIEGIELQDAGVEADVWKIEGIERRRTASGSSRRPAAAAATGSAASSWAAGRTTRRCGSG